MVNEVHALSHAQRFDHAPVIGTALCLRLQRNQAFLFRLFAIAVVIRGRSCEAGHVCLPVSTRSTRGSGMTHMMAART